ncbi:MAG: M28 family metallopeptidase, partial [Dehalococcoidia bacterium]
GSVGANDNASGTAVLLTLAQEVKDTSLPFTLQFVAFGSEEIGLLGSSNYVVSLQVGALGRIRAMLNLDSVGSGEPLVVGGDFDLVNAVLEAATERGIEATMGREPQGAVSDHFVFRAGGVPVVFFIGRDISRINSPEDTLEFVEPELLGDAVNLGLGLLIALAEEGAEGFRFP